MQTWTWIEFCTYGRHRGWANSTHTNHWFFLLPNFCSAQLVFYRNRLPNFFHLLWNSKFDKDAWIAMDDFFFSLGSSSIYFKKLKINFHNNYPKNVNCFCRIVFSALLECLWKTFIWGLTYHEAFLKGKSPIGSKEIGVHTIHHLMS